MKPFGVLALLLTTATAFAEGQTLTSSPKKAAKPDAVVRELYREVVALHPIGLPWGRNKDAFRPLLSKDLAGRFDTAWACESDYYRTHKDPSLKPEIEWLEFGVFSGGNEEASPATAAVERVEREGDGSFRAYVRLTYKDTYATYSDHHIDPRNSFNWRVAVIVIPERSRFLVNDVLFFKDEPKDTKEVDFTLSHLLTMGCDGARWVGYKDAS